MDEFTVQTGQFGDPVTVAPPLLVGGEEGDQGIDGNVRTDHAAAEAHDVGMVVPAGQAGGRHVVHDRGADAGDLVGGHGDPVARAAGAVE